MPGVILAENIATSSERFRTLQTPLENEQNPESNNDCSLIGATQLSKDMSEASSINALSFRLIHPKRLELPLMQICSSHLDRMRLEDP